MVLIQYAPKDKQTSALCSTPPLSICDSVYGLSIGRGSFRFAAGNWTHVRQTVTLNTPGMQDGAFALDVNGVRVIDRDDVFYRDVPSPLPLSRRAPFPAPESSNPSAAAPERPPPIGVRIAFPARQGIFHGRTPAGVDQDDTDAPADIRRMTLPLRDFTPVFVPYQNASVDPPASGPAARISPSAAGLPPVLTSTVTSTTTVVPPPQTVTAPPTQTETAYVVAMATGTAAPSAGAIAVKVPEPIGFSGLFFRCVAMEFGWLCVAVQTNVAETKVFICSTFFGGHEKKYATPRDQFTWFKDFAMMRNA